MAWLTTKLDDPEWVALCSRRVWVQREWTKLVLMGLVLPMALLIGLFLPDPNGLAILFLLLVLLTVPLVGPMVVPRTLLARYERPLLSLNSLELPLLYPAEAVILQGFMQLNSGFGFTVTSRAILTSERIIFQLPSYRFLPPFKPGPVREFLLSKIQRIEVIETGMLTRMFLKNRPPYPLLRIESSDGTWMEFLSLGADAWNAEIQRTKAVLQANPG